MVAFCRSADAPPALVPHGSAGLRLEEREVSRRHCVSGQAASKSSLQAAQCRRARARARDGMQSMCSQCPEQALGGGAGTRVSRCVSGRHHAA